MMSDLNHSLSVKGHLPSFLCSLPPPPNALSLRGFFRERLIYDICWRRTKLWPSPVAQGNMSSAFFCPGTVHLDWGMEPWGDEKNNFVLIKNKISVFQVSNGSPGDWNYGSTGREQRKEGGRPKIKEMTCLDSIWNSSFLHCPHWLHFLSKRRPRRTDQVQELGSSTFLSKPLKGGISFGTVKGLTSSQLLSSKLASRGCSNRLPLEPRWWDTGLASSTRVWFLTHVSASEPCTWGEFEEDAH